MRQKGFLKTLKDQIEFFFDLSWWEKWWVLKFLFIMGVALLGFKRKKKKLVNTFFDLNDLSLFGSELKKAVLFHERMAKQLLNPKHKGVRAWEYGVLLANIKLRRGMKVLDVGSGSSALPFYLAKKGARVTAFDLEKPLEPANIDLVRRFPNVTYDRGTALKLPYKSDSFDLVVCITAIEHLDYDFSKHRPLAYKTFLKHTGVALGQMIRVLKSGGRLFLTSELYFPELQRTDRYAQAYLYKGAIGAVYKRQDFEKVFLEKISKLGCKFVGRQDFGFEKILKDSNRCNFRGRYFTTFSIYAQKT